MCTTFLSVVELDSDINKCCPACFNRIARMMGTNPQTNEPLVAQVPDDNADGQFIYLTIARQILGTTKIYCA